MRPWWLSNNLCDRQLSCYTFGRELGCLPVPLSSFFLLDIKTFLWLTFRISRHFFESQCEVDSITTTTHCLRKKSFSAWGCWKREAVKRALRNVNNRIAAFLESLLRCPLFLQPKKKYFTVVLNEEMLCVLLSSHPFS